MNRLKKNLSNLPHPSTSPTPSTSPPQLSLPPQPPPPPQFSPPPPPSKLTLLLADHKVSIPKGFTLD